MCPTYTYECQECGHQQDVFHKISEDPEIQCEECNHTPCKRLIGKGGGVIFKGSGFYATDYKRMEAVAKESATPRKEKKHPEIDAIMDHRIEHNRRETPEEREAIIDKVKKDT